MAGRGRPKASGGSWMAEPLEGAPQGPQDTAGQDASAAAGPLSAEALLDAVRWGPDGLVPAIAVDRVSGRVLMLAYMNREALHQTLRTGRATYFSRSRQCLWTKGETSGNVQQVREVRLDCDGDALLLVVDQHGAGACHTGEWSCFFRFAPVSLDTGTGPQAGPDGQHDVPHDAPADARILDELRRVIQERHRHPRPGSYTASLFARGIDASLKKLAEEAGEVILAAKNVDALKKPGGAAAPAGDAPSDPAALGQAYDALAWEAADLLYHLLVVLEDAGLPCEAVWRELLRRRRG